MVSFSCSKSQRVGSWFEPETVFHTDTRSLKLEILGVKGLESIHLL